MLRACLATGIPLTVPDGAAGAVATGTPGVNGIAPGGGGNCPAAGGGGTDPGGGGPFGKPAGGGGIPLGNPSVGTPPGKDGGGPLGCCGGCDI